MANEPAAKAADNTQKAAEPKTEAKANAGKKEEAKVTELVHPLGAGRFGLTRHRARQFRSNVPPSTTKKQLEDGRFWAHYAGQMNLHDEIRVVADDSSFMADLMVTFKHGNNVRVKVINFHELEVVDYAKESGMDKFHVENRGAVGWCVIQNDTGDMVFSNLPSQSAAMGKLEEYVKVLGR